MAETATERAAAVEKVLGAIQGEPGSVKEAALQATSARGPDGETVAERAAAVEQVLEATKEEDSSVKEAALQAAAPRLEPPIKPPVDVEWLWKALILGLLILTGAALIGVLITVLDGNDKTDSDKLLIVFTPLLSGLLGLFIASPTQGGTAPQTE